MSTEKVAHIGASKIALAVELARLAHHLDENVIIVGHAGAGSLVAADLGEAAKRLAQDTEKEINATRAVLEAAAPPMEITNPYEGLDLIGGPKPITCKKVKHQYLKNKAGVWQCSCGKTL